MFCIYVHIYSSPLHQIQNLTQSLKSNQDCTLCPVFLFSLPILFKALSVLCTYPEHQMIFDCSLAGGAGSSVAGPETVESSDFQHVDLFVVRDAEGVVAVGIEDSAAGGFVWSEA